MVEGTSFFFIDIDFSGTFFASASSSSASSLAELPSSSSTSPSTESSSSSSGETSTSIHLLILRHWLQRPCRRLHQANTPFTSIKKTLHSPPSSEIIFIFKQLLQTSASEESPSFDSVALFRLSYNPSRKS